MPDIVLMVQASSKTCMDVGFREIKQINTVQHCCKFKQQNWHDIATHFEHDADVEMLLSGPSFLPSTVAVATVVASTAVIAARV